MISETLPKVRDNKAYQSKKPYNSERSADRNQKNILLPRLKNPQFTQSLSHNPADLNTGTLAGRSKRASESQHQSLLIEKEHNDSLFPVKVSRRKEQSFVEERGRNSAIYVGQPPSNQISPHSKQSVASFDFNTVINEPAIRNQLSREREYNDQIAVNITISKESKHPSHRNRSEHNDSVVLPAKNQREFFENSQKTMKKDPEYAFKLTLNEKFHTGLSEFQKYLNYCNPVELERQVRISEMKSKMNQKRRDLDNSTQMFGDLALNDYNSSQIVYPTDMSQYYREQMSRKYRENKPFKLRDISYNRDYSRDFNIADTSAVIDRSKFSPLGEDTRRSRTPKASYKELNLEGNSFMYDSLVTEKTFESRFRKIEPIKGATKQIEYMAFLREKHRIKLEAQKGNLHKAPFNLKAARVQKKSKKPSVNVSENNKILIKLMENEFELQNEKIEALTQRFIEEFDIH